MKKQKSTKPNVGRREFIAGTTAAAAGVALGGCGDDAAGEDTDGATDSGGRASLRILKWIHFVPAHDQWYDSMALAWGEANNVDVTIEHQPLGEIGGVLAAAIEAGEGPDLIESPVSLALYENDIEDISDVVSEGEQTFGALTPFAKAAGSNPLTGKVYGYTLTYALWNGNYPRDKWEALGMPNGPTTWAELLTMGSMIRDTDPDRAVVALGLSGSVDSRYGIRAPMYSFGSSVQDASEQIALDSMATREVLEYMRELFNTAMDLSVVDNTSWDSTGNNNALIGGIASYTIDPISAYRVAQSTVPDVAANLFVLPALQGPSAAVAPTLPLTYGIPTYSTNASVAKDFLRHLATQASEDVLRSELYNFPGHPGAVPELSGPNGWLHMDPRNSVPLDKLATLENSVAWSTNLGYPGPSNAAIAEVFGNNIIVDMFRTVCTGEAEIEAAISTALSQIDPIFAKWRDAGLIGG